MFGKNVRVITLQLIKIKNFYSSKNHFETPFLFIFFLAIKCKNGEVATPLGLDKTDRPLALTKRIGENDEAKQSDHGIF